MPERQYYTNIRKINSGQHNCEWCERCVKSKKEGQMGDSYRIFLSRPVGTGKCHVIILIYRDVIYFFHKTNHVTKEDPLALLTAFAGTASFNISETTLHSVFQLGTHTSVSSDEKKTILCTKLYQLQLIVTNECSMEN